MDMIYWDHYYNALVLLNLLIVTGLFACLRLFSGKIAHINASDELLNKDNPAFGISLAGATFAITIMLSGAVYGSPENGAAHAVMATGLFGLLGIGLMALTRIVFDKITLPAVSMSEEIVRGNKAVALADAGNVLAVAIIIRAVMVWVTAFSWQGILALLGGYAVSQIILTAMTKGFEAFHKGNNLQEELNKGNVALALRFAGHKIGTAFAITTAAGIVVYEEYEVLPILGVWLAASIIVVLIWKVLSMAASRLILFKVDVDDEVIRQGNIALGVLQAVIYISMGLLISAL